MAKAGDVAYTSVQRPKAGEGYVLFFLIFFTRRTDPHYFQLDPDGDRDPDSDFYVKKLIIVGSVGNHFGCCSLVVAYIIGNGFSFKHK
jgi:hypothetical protein